MPDTQKDAVSRYPIWVQSSICLFGVVLYLMSFSSSGAYIGPEVFRQLGLSVFIFGLTSFVLTHHYSQLMVAQLQSLEEKVTSQTLDTFDLIRSIRDSDIARIYPLRTGESAENPDAERPFRERLKLEFSKAARQTLETRKSVTIRMMGISLRAFFNDAGAMFGTAEYALRNDLLKFEILLIDPFSAQAGLRGERETQTHQEHEYASIEEHFRSTLFTDIQKCSRSLLPFTEAEKDKRVEVRLYSTAPSCMLIFINESVFVETYHYGRSGIGGLKGGKVPVIEFHSDTGTYRS